MASKEQKKGADNGRIGKYLKDGHRGYTNQSQKQPQRNMEKTKRTVKQQNRSYNYRYETKIIPNRCESL